jgi:phage tail sheath protein FI
MPEYLAPGVYVEEVSYRSKIIEGVSTTTTGFIGPARYGPIDLPPDILTSLGEFERVHGDGNQLDYGNGNQLDNFLWHGVRAFFEEGGKRLYITRVFRPSEDAPYTPPPANPVEDDATLTSGNYPDGHARFWLPATPTNENERDASVLVRARFPGAVGNLRVKFTLTLGQNVLGQEKREVGGVQIDVPKVRGLVSGDVVWINDMTSPIDSPPGSGALYLAESFFDTVKNEDSWRFNKLTSPTDTRLLEELTPNTDPKSSDNVRVVSLTVTVTPADGSGSTQVWDNLPLDPGHQRAGSLDSVFARFAATPTNSTLARTLPVTILHGGDISDGLAVVELLLQYDDGLSRAGPNPKPFLRTALNDLKSSAADRSVEILLTGGHDGVRPQAEEYEGRAEEDQATKTGLKAFEDLEDISIIAAPGATYGYQNGYSSHAATINNLLISHAERMRYRIAVLDSGNAQAITDVRAMRARIDSKYAALYYPWVRVLDPITRKEIHLPPSGFVAGIYCRNDINRGVYKAPANEVVNLALGFEVMLNKSQQDVLNPEGINCFRFFEGRGYRLWGARTISSDPEWKYVNLRRYFAYVERSLDRGTQWAVFEPNGEQLWANVRRTISDFLLNEWQNGALLGEKPEKAFFVRCDRSTMTQNDLDNGRLVCLIGIAPLRPAEFVIFRIGQWTADRKS